MGKQEEDSSEKESSQSQYKENENTPYDNQEQEQMIDVSEKLFFILSQALIENKKSVFDAFAKYVQIYEMEDQQYEHIEP